MTFDGVNLRDNLTIYKVLGSMLHLCTMIGAIVTHIVLSFPGVSGVTILGALSAYTLYFYRGQLVSLEKS